MSDGGADRRPSLTLLDAAALARRCVRSHLSPSADLAPFVEVAWTLRWDLGEGETFVQRVLPEPAVQIVVDSRGGAQVFGVVTGPYASRLDGAAFVLGLKFRPGGFHPVLRRSVAELTDRQVPLGELLPGVDAARLTGLAAAADGPALLRALEAALRAALGARRPRADQQLALVTEAVARVAAEPAVRRAEDAARVCGLGVRALQRLLRTHVGVGPRWLIRRARLKAAAAQAEAGGVVNWAGLAADLGYFDQAHLTNDFATFVGRPPGAYAASLAAARL